jgi:hypothetical protein
LGDAVSAYDELWEDRTDLRHELVARMFAEDSDYIQRLAEEVARLTPAETAVLLERAKEIRSRIT